jgi:hypothetical protein
MTRNEALKMFAARESGFPVASLSKSMNWGAVCIPNDAGGMYGKATNKGAKEVHERSIGKGQKG